MNAGQLSRLITGLFLALLPAGCQTLTSFKPPTLPSGTPTPSMTTRQEEVKPQKQLPPKEAAEVSFTLAESLAANGHDKDAILHYERCRQFDANRAGIAPRLAVLYGRIGETKKSLEEFDKAIKETPQDASLHNNRGYCLYSAGQWAEAEQSYRQALALDSNHAHAWVNLGMSLGMQGRYAESYEAFTKTLSPAEAHANLGFIYFSQGKKEQARDAYRQALHLNPSMQKAQLVLNMMDAKPNTTKLATTSSGTDKSPILPVMVPPLPERTIP